MITTGRVVIMPCRRVCVVLSFLALVIFTGGCQRVYNFVPVEGTLTKDGKPLAGVQIIFLADPSSGTEGPRSVGTTDAEGHYRLQTDCGVDGAVVGKHIVCIVEPDVYADERTALRHRLGASSKEARTSTQRDAETGSSLVPPNYSRIDKSPLRAEVLPRGVQTIDFNIPETIPE